MKKSTIHQLNDLNDHFYKTISAEFSKTRANPWEGWKLLLPSLQSYFDNEELTVLDVGCGNGRFAEFLAKEFQEHDFKYIGVDSNAHLLQLARESLLKILPENQIQLIQTDIVTEVPKIPTDIMTLFGVIHHIPSKELRIKCMLEFERNLNEGGLLIIAAWQFDKLPNIFARKKQPQDFGLDPAELEENDFILDWVRDKEAARYCHLVTPEEMDELIAMTHLEKITEFYADGPENNANYYVILHKPQNKEPESSLLRS